MYILLLLLLFLFGGVTFFIPSRNLDEVFIYNIYGSNVPSKLVLTRADHLFIHNYIRSLLNNILRPIL